MRQRKRIVKFKNACLTNNPELDPDPKLNEKSVRKKVSIYLPEVGSSDRSSDIPIGSD